MAAPIHEIIQTTYQNPHATAGLKLNVMVVSNTSEEDIERNIRNSSAKYHDWLYIKDQHDTPAILIGGGDSINDHIDDIRELQRKGAVVFAMNGSSQWARSHGIPVDYQVIVDAKEETSTLVDSEANEHIFASQCHEKTLEKAHDLTLFHFAVPNMESFFPPERVKQGGYVLLGWAEVGFIHVFTNTLVSKPADLKSLKLWTWEGDPIAQAAFEALDLSPIPLSLENVLTSLQTGLLDSYYAPPYAALVLQWYTRTKYMINVPLANSSGAVMLSKKYYDALPEDLQEILMRNGRAAFRKLTELSREENKQAIEEFKKRGMKIIEARPEDLQIYIDAGQMARNTLAGRMYSKDLQQRVERELEAFRSGKASSK